MCIRDRAGPAYCQVEVKIRSRSSSSTAGSEYQEAGSVQPSSSGRGTGGSAYVVWVSVAKPVLTVRSVRISVASRMGQDGNVSAVSQTNERVVAILEAACRVVVREGAHGLRMAAVAREAGVSKALVHYYFATRQELVRIAFSWSEEQWQSALKERIREAPDALERIEQALLLTIDPTEPFAEHRALWNEVWSSLRFDDDLRPLVDSSYQKWIRRLTTLVREARAEGAIDAATDPRETAWRLAALADGIDSMLYLELLGRARARTLLREGVRRELGL